MLEAGRSACPPDERRSNSVPGAPLTAMSGTYDNLA